jgi:hypothetical protein
VVIAHAGAVYDLVRAIPAGSSAVSRADAVQHAHALLGFYEAYGPRRWALIVRGEACSSTPSAASAAPSRDLRRNPGLDDDLVALGL